MKNSKHKIRNSKQTQKLKNKNSNRFEFFNFEFMRLFPDWCLDFRIYKNLVGATIVELLLYMGILLILIGILSTFFSSALDLQLESSSVSSVDRDGEYLLSRLNYDFHRAQSVTIPASSGATGSTLSLSISGVTYSYSLDASGNMQYTNNLGTFTLNSFDTKITNLSFTKLSNVGGVEDTVQISFTLSALYLQHKGYETKNFQTTIAVR